LYLSAYHFAETRPDKVSEVRRDEWRSKAEELAAEYARQPSYWEGSANALAFYRSTGQTKVADSLETQIENTFAESLQPIRDGVWFEKRDLRRFEREIATANSFTKHLYALLLYEQGQTQKALDVVKESLEKSKLQADALVSAVETLQLMKQFEESRKLAEDYLASGSGWDCLELSIYVLKYFAGDIDEEELLEFAYPFHSSVCHTEHMVGVWHLARGNREEARKHLKASVATGRIGWGSYARAKAYLNRMKEDSRWLEN
jgi:tetratricopeptide (TPR) repeat protein